MCSPAEGGHVSGKDLDAAGWAGRGRRTLGGYLARDHTTRTAVAEANCELVLLSSFL